jgi:hypothetical protein
LEKATEKMAPILVDIRHQQKKKGPVCPEANICLHILYGALEYAISRPSSEGVC